MQFKLFYKRSKRGFFFFFFEGVKIFKMVTYSTGVNTGSWENIIKNIPKSQRTNGFFFNLAGTKTKNRFFVNEHLQNVWIVYRGALFRVTGRGGRVVFKKNTHIFELNEQELKKRRVRSRAVYRANKQHAAPITADYSSRQNARRVPAGCYALYM